jgi:hypothetical protein
MELKLEVGRRYVVTKASADGTFEKGDHISLTADGCINCKEAEGWVEAADVPLATDGMEVEVDTAFYEKRIAALQAAMK